MKYDIKTLGTVATYINGRAFKPNEWEDNGLPIIRIQNLTNNNSKYNYSSVEHDSKFLVKNGDLLFAWSASLGAYIWNSDNAWLNQHIFKVIPNDDIDKKYLYYFLVNIVNELYAKTHGSGMVHITKAPFMNTKIPVPHIERQKQIVARIEELFSQLDSGVETLKMIKQQLTVYKQAVLKEAFKSCPERVKIETVCCTVTDGDHQPPPKAEKGIPFIMISNIADNKINWDNTAFVSDDYYKNLNDNRRPQKGDVLYTVTGSFGIPVMVDFDNKFCFQRHIALLRPDENSINQKFLFYALQTPNVYIQARDKATGTAQKTVGLTVLRKITIPFTESIQEQKNIVKDIENKLSVCDSIETAVKTGLQQAEALKQSILKKAFEGGLL